MSEPTLGAYDIADLREQARQRLPRGVFEFFDRGNGDEVALANNRAAFERIKLNPHMLVDTSRRSQHISLFGKTQAMPVVVGPTGSAGLAWYEGEVALARAASGRQCWLLLHGTRWSAACRACRARPLFSAGATGRSSVLRWCSLSRAC